MDEYGQIGRGLYRARPSQFSILPCCRRTKKATAFVVASIKILSLMYWAALVQKGTAASLERNQIGSVDRLLLENLESDLYKRTSADDTNYQQTAWQRTVF